jgi:hypothetical protein
MVSSKPTQLVLKHISFGFWVVLEGILRSGLFFANNYLLFT